MRRGLSIYTTVVRTIYNVDLSTLQIHSVLTVVGVELADYVMLLSAPGAASMAFMIFHFNGDGLLDYPLLLTTSSRPVNSQFFGLQWEFLCAPGSLWTQ